MNDLWIAGTVADYGRVLLNVEQVDGNIALEQHVVDGCLHFKA